jgi:hypothetical protein
VQFCEEHWTRLKTAIAVEGIDHLVPSGKEALANIVHELEHGASAATFDPLMASHWAIVGRIAEHAPEVVLIDGCPLCWVAEMHEASCRDAGCEVTRQTFEDWIPSVAAHMRGEWERLALESA